MGCWRKGILLPADDGRLSARRHPPPLLAAVCHALSGHLGGIATLPARTAVAQAVCGASVPPRRL